MAKFAFRLQALLELKVQLEESLKNELGKAVRKLEKEKQTQQRLEAEMGVYINRFNNDAGSGIAAGKLKEYSVYIAHLKNRIELQKENVNFALHSVDKYRGQLVKAMQEREMLERLRVKKLEEFRKQELKREQAINDEIISFKLNSSLTGENDG